MDEFNEKYLCDLDAAAQSWSHAEMQWMASSEALRVAQEASSKAYEQAKRAREELEALEMESAQPWSYWLMPPRLASQARIAKSSKVFEDAFGLMDRGFEDRMHDRRGFDVWLWRHDEKGSLAQALVSAVEALWPEWSALSEKPLQFAWRESDAAVVLDVSKSAGGMVVFQVNSSGPNSMSTNKVCSGSLSDCSKAFEEECRFYDGMDSDEDIADM